MRSRAVELAQRAAGHARLGAAALEQRRQLGEVGREGGREQRGQVIARADLRDAVERDGGQRPRAAQETVAGGGDGALCERAS